MQIQSQFLFDSFLFLLVTLKTYGSNGDSDEYTRNQYDTHNGHLTSRGKKEQEITFNALRSTDIGVLA